ncbi:MAG: hypothetical protein S4CHLAM81_09390 [Chlamydiales bacterium]|nr:hypothetical protein [Chlamydiales bacterium]MCH9635718.1 hypothetical protein [Chlamydiales bacterium]
MTAAVSEGANIVLRFGDIGFDVSNRRYVRVEGQWVHQELVEKVITYMPPQASNQSSTGHRLSAEVHSPVESLELMHDGRRYFFDLDEGWVPVGHSESS